MGPYALQVRENVNEMRRNYPEIMEPTFEEYEMTRRELHETYMRRFKLLNDKGQDKFFLNVAQNLREFAYYNAWSQFVDPMTLHGGMFIYALLYLADPE